jgi:hypothetical protein
VVCRQLLGALALRLLFATRVTCQWTCKIGSCAIAVEGDEVRGGEGKRPPSFKLAGYANNSAWCATVRNLMMCSPR